MRITGDLGELGKLEIRNFVAPESIYSVIATSKLLGTGVDVKSYQLVCIDE